MLVKFSTIGGGLFVEETGKAERSPSDRCFRFDGNGNAEYCFFADAGEYNPRFYSHCFHASQFTFA